jgi:hypothetical protein
VVFMSSSLQGLLCQYSYFICVSGRSLAEGINHYGAILTRKFHMINCNSKVKKFKTEVPCLRRNEQREAKLIKRLAEGVPFQSTYEYFPRKVADIFYSLLVFISIYCRYNSFSDGATQQKKHYIVQWS